jgi:ribosomal protein S14
MDQQHRECTTGRRTRCTQGGLDDIVYRATRWWLDGKRFGAADDQDVPGSPHAMVSVGLRLCVQCLRQIASGLVEIHWLMI